MKSKLLSQCSELFLRTDQQLWRQVREEAWKMAK